MTNTFIILQVGYWQPTILGYYFLLATLLAVVLFFITGEPLLWYRKAKEKISGQQKHTKLIKQQNKLLRQLAGSPDFDE